eukprot:1160635-Amphidinium_carterae.1
MNRSFRLLGSNSYFKLLTSCILAIVLLVLALHVIALERIGLAPNLEPHFEVPSFSRAGTCHEHDYSSRCFRAYSASCGNMIVVSQLKDDTTANRHFVDSLACPQASSGKFGKGRLCPAISRAPSQTFDITTTLILEAAILSD